MRAADNRSARSGAQGGQLASVRHRAASPPPRSARRVLLLALYPIFGDLGGPYLWEDEADTAVFAQRIVATGFPDRVGRPQLPRQRLRLPRRAARARPGLPDGRHAVAAVLRDRGVVRALRRVERRARDCRSRSRRSRRSRCSTRSCCAPRSAGARRSRPRCCSSRRTQFLLYAREARSYGFNMLFTMVLLYGFVRLEGRRRDPWLVVAAVLLFHTQIIPAAIALGAIGALALFHPRFRPLLRPLLLARSAGDRADGAVAGARLDGDADQLAAARSRARVAVAHGAARRGVDGRDSVARLGDRTPAAVAPLQRGRSGSAPRSRSPTSRCSSPCCRSRSTARCCS